MKIITESEVTNADVKEILEGMEKKKELKYEQKNVLSMLRKLAKSTPENIRKLVEELKGMERLREKQIVAIANFLPEDKDDLRVVLHKEYAAFTPEEIDKILEIVRNNI